MPHTTHHTDRSTVIINNFDLLAQSAENFDPRFTLRALRSISTIRKADNLPTPILIAIRTAFPQDTNPARRVLEDVLPQSPVEGLSNGFAGAKDKESDEAQMPEIWSYLGVLVQVGR